MRITRTAWAGAACAIVIAAALASVGWSLSSSDVIGHDDGIYLQTARSLSESGEYRLIGLPRSLAQTKYPPLYPLVLAAALKVTPALPQGIWWLKGVNAILLAATVLLTVATARLLRSSWAGSLAAGALAGSAPGLLSFVDLIATEPLFTALLMAVVVLVARDATDEHRPPLWLIGAIAGLTMVTRSAGIATVGAVAVWALFGRGVPGAALAVAGSLVTVGPWAVWRVVQASGSAGPLERYYTSYETSAYAYLLWTPGTTAQIIWTNAAAYRNLTSVAFAWATPWLAVVCLAAVVTGWRVVPRPLRLWFLSFASLYGAVILGHPYAVGRYLVPLLPSVILLIVCGAGEWQRRLSGKWIPAPVARAIPATVVGLLLFVHGTWLLQYRAVQRAHVHAAFGRPLPFGWAGFRETFAWIREHTPPDAVLTSANDPIYFVYTGRRAVRSWVHDAESYTAGYARQPGRSVLQGASLQAEFDRLGVGYLVVDPLLQDGEGEAGRRAVKSVLTLPGVWTLAFQSGDGLHTVYKRR